MIALLLATVTATWDPTVDDRLGGYRLYCGRSPGVYETNFTIAAPGTSFVVSNLQPATTYYFAVSALEKDGLESPLSDEASVTTMAYPVINVTLHFEEACDPAGPFVPLTNAVMTLSLPLPEGSRFYRGRLEVK